MVSDVERRRAPVDMKSVLAFDRWNVGEKKVLMRPEVSFLAVKLIAIFVVRQTLHDARNTTSFSPRSMMVVA